MGIFVVLVSICTIIEGLFWYESDDSLSATQKKEPVVQMTKISELQSGSDNNGYIKSEYSVEMSQVRMHSIFIFLEWCYHFTKILN